MAVIAFFCCSLDLRIADADGDFSWAEPSEALHAFANDLERGVGTHVYGRRMYEVMRFWESMPDEDSVMGDYGRVWRGTDKVVVSTTIDAVDTERTRLERAFDPAALRRLADGSPTDVTVGGAQLAAAALLAGAVDEVQLLVVPVIVGSGPRAIPEGLRADLELLEARTFDEGWQYLRYRVGAAA